MRLGLPALATVIVLLAGAGAAAAAGFGFLADSPIGKFNEDDLKLMNGAIDKALTASTPGVRTRWANEKSGSSGEVTPQRAFERNGRACRDVKIVNRHKTLEASGIYTMCRDDGQWKLAQ
jgi:surface antigen